MASDRPSRPYRTGAFLLLALVEWAPSARALLAGRLDATAAAERFVAALVVAYVAVRFVATVIDGYAAAAAELQEEEPAAPPRNRRRDDSSRSAARDAPKAGPKR